MPLSPSNDRPVPPADTAEPAAPRGLRLSVETDAAQPAQPYVYAQVVGVQTAQGSQDLTLDIEDYGLRSSLEITALR